MPNTSPLAIASGSTATAAIGQIAAMNVANVHVSTKLPRRRHVGHQEQHRDEAEHIAPQRRVTLRRRAEQHDPNTTERDQREHQRPPIVELPEEHGADRHDEKRRERTDQRGVGDAVMCRPAKKMARLSPKNAPGISA